MGLFLNLNLLRTPAEPAGVGPLEKKLADKHKAKLPEPPPVPKSNVKELLRTGSQSFESGPLDPKDSVSILRLQKRKKKRSKKRGRGSSRKKSRKDASDETSDHSSGDDSSSGGSLDSQDSGHPFAKKGIG